LTKISHELVETARDDYQYKGDSNLREGIVFWGENYLFLKGRELREISIRLR